MLSRSTAGLGADLPDVLLGDHVNRFTAGICVDIPSLVPIYIWRWRSHAVKVQEMTKNVER